MVSIRNNVTRLNCELIPHAVGIFRSLFRSIWKKTTGKRWKNNSEDGKEFISSLGKNIWISATRRQKELLESGNVNMWDLKLLNHVLQRMKLKDGKKNQIRSLYDVCNDASHDDETLTNDELTRIAEMVKNLNSLVSDVTEHLEEMDLEDVWEKSLNDLLAEDFRKAAAEYCERKKFSNAINTYTEAIILTGHSKELLGKLYFNRSEVYLMEKSVEDGVLFILNALRNEISFLEDAKRAVQLLSGSPEAYFQLACAYFALNKHKKALRCLNIACEIEKPPPKAAEMRKECEKKIEDMKMEEEAMCCAEQFPKNRAELVSQFNKRSAIYMTEEKLLKLEKALKDVKDPTVTVLQAHRCMVGFDCEKNCKLGIELYEEAAEQGNVEAMYCLGVIYREGKLVEKDLKKALMYLDKAAESNVIDKTGYKLIGVSEAQFELGFMHYKGIGFSRDYNKAIKLFTKSCENGNKDAARTLGQLYFNGNCVEKDVERAVQFWDLAAKRYDVIAMQTLAEYYLKNDVDPDQALKWHYQAIESGNLIAKKLSEEFIWMAENIKKDVQSADDEMIRWEKKNGFFGLGDSMDKRRRRFMEYKLPGCSQFGEYLSKVPTGECLPGGFKKREKGSELTLDLIEESIAKGGIYAREIKEAFLHIEKGKNYLTSLDRSCWRIIVHELAESFRVTERIMQWDFVTHSKANKLVSWARSLTDNIGQIDRDLRICHVVFNLNSLDVVLQILEESIELYPDDIWFLQMLCSLIGFRYEHERGAKMAEEGLAKEPNNVDLLYLRAAHMGSLENVDRGKIIKAGEKFLAVAPPDHFKVPEIYFGLALQYTIGKERKSTSWKLVAEYYNLGLEAEKKQIPFFLDKTNEQRVLLEQMMCLNPFKKAVIRQQAVGGGTNRVEKQLTKPKEEKKKEIDDGIEADRLKTLRNPRREGIIRDHRNIIYTSTKQDSPCKQEANNPCDDQLVSLSINLKVKCTAKPNLKQKAPPQLAEVKSITIREMDPFKEHVYDGFELKCVIIDEPILEYTGVGIVVEDENGDVERVSVYNIEKNEVHKKIGYGCQITILNPYFKMAYDQKQLIRVDDLESVIFDAGPDLSRCRYCGKSGAVKKCARCLKASYCSKECQERDWKILRHKFVCKKI